MVQLVDAITGEIKHLNVPWSIESNQTATGLHPHDLCVWLPPLRLLHVSQQGIIRITSPEPVLRSDFKT